MGSCIQQKKIPTLNSSVVLELFSQKVLFELARLVRRNWEHIHEFSGGDSVQSLGLECLKESLSSSALKREPWFGIRSDGELVGALDVYSCEIPKNSYTVGLWVDKDMCGRGIGTLALQALVDYIFENLKGDAVLAEIHIDNLISEKIFAGTGFRLLSPAIRNNRISWICRKP